MIKLAAVVTTTLLAGNALALTVTSMAPMARMPAPHETTPHAPPVTPERGPVVDPTRIQGRARTQVEIPKPSTTDTLRIEAERAKKMLDDELARQNTEQARRNGDRTLIGRDIFENRVAKVAEVLSFRADTKSDLVLALKRSPEVSAGFRQIEDMLAKAPPGKLWAPEEITLMETAAEWLSLALHESDIVDIHLVFADAMKGDYEVEITAILREAIDAVRDSKGVKSLKVATREAMSARTLTEQAFRDCDKVGKG